MFLSIWGMSKIDYNMLQVGTEHFMNYLETLNGSMDLLKSIN